jgi:hypothetical protein
MIQRVKSDMLITAIFLRSIMITRNAVTKMTLFVLDFLIYIYIYIRQIKQILPENNCCRDGIIRVHSQFIPRTSG